MKRYTIGPIALCLATLLLAAPSRADPGKTDLEKHATEMATRLAALCPAAPRDSVDAHTACARALRDASFIPFARSGLLFGGDQPGVRLSKKQLTHLKPGIFQFLYLSLFTFTGH